MTASSARPPRLLLTATLLLAVVGVVLLAMPDKPSASAPPLSEAAPPDRSSSPSPHARPTAEAGIPGAVTTTAATTQSALPSPLPPHGEGVAGDRVIQQALETAWLSDLDPRDERQLLAAARALLRADATGIGRARWPAYFGDADQAIAPAFAAARFRVQAAIARRDGSSDRAVVHLVWAGTDRGGTYTDGRITDLHFTRTISTKKGGSPWAPQPRT
ncbi:hypothetical protein [Streptomyces brasiliensis]|uniref:Uncharacterized protein n=1 Tax=Streptomyces brasiliensis TaxID=1954 RepID=A0A917P2H0_9ACTN|nr:hypothetical protein [Streptomyces brasiliensis]GGJ56446.1 hypothetical protein GCM10010121_078810 [Streptomyces brasiliensis]